MTDPDFTKPSFDEKIQDLLQFIEDARDGKFTDQKPILTDIAYTRIEIQEQESEHLAEEPQALLFGLSY